VCFHEFRRDGASYRLYPRGTDFALIVLGTFLIVGGIVLVAWKPDEQISRLIGGFISEPPIGAAA
jgi:hypothetical protein